MNVAHLTTITTDNASLWDQQAIENRLRAIATNAVRESRVALGRDAGPWLDDDARRLNMIFELLHLANIPMDMSTEALPVAAPQQAARDAAMESIEKALLKIQTEEPTTTSRAAKK